jgi:hypothetical protein
VTNFQEKKKKKKFASEIAPEQSGKKMEKI